MRRKTKKFMLGGNTRDPLEDYLNFQRQRKENNPTRIEAPETALFNNQLAMNRADQAVANNPWTNALDTVGAMALSTGTSMATQGFSGGEGMTTGDGFKFFGKAAFGTPQGMSPLVAPQQGVVEVEGKEFANMPNGQSLDFEGPSHEQGGIPVSLPPGTEIFSDRIKIDGVSMAGRGKKRKKKQMSLEELLDHDPTDALLKNTIDRTLQVQGEEEEFDTSIQDFVGKMMNEKFPEEGNPEKFAYGTGKRPKWATGDFDMNYLMDMYGGDGSSDFSNKKVRTDLQTQWGVKPDGIFGPKSNEAMMASRPRATPVSSLPKPMTSSTQQTPSPWGELSPLEDTRTPVQLAGRDGPVGQGGIMNTLRGFVEGSPNPTFGDALGLYGNYQQSRAPMKNVMANRAGDMANLNHYTQFGKDGLAALEESKGYVAGQRDQNMMEIDAGTRNMITHNRGSARGINTMRALDLAANQAGTQAKSGIQGQYAKLMMDILANQAQMENQQDQVVMGAEAQRDQFDREDRDNFFTQLGQAELDKYRGLAQTGKSLNQMKSREVTENAINDMHDLLQTDSRTGKVSIKEGAVITPNMHQAIAEFDYTSHGYSKKAWEALDDSDKAVFIATNGSQRPKTKATNSKNK